MKRHLAASIFSLSLFALVACGGAEESAEQSDSAIISRFTAFSIGADEMRGLFTRLDLAGCSIGVQSGQMVATLSPSFARALNSRAGAAPMRSSIAGDGSGSASLVSSRFDLADSSITATFTLADASGATIELSADLVPSTNGLALAGTRASCTAGCGRDSSEHALEMRSQLSGLLRAFLARSDVQNAMLNTLLEDLQTKTGLAWAVNTASAQFSISDGELSLLAQAR